MSFYNFVRNEQSGADVLYIDGEIVTYEDWWGPDGQVVARNFRRRLAQCGDVTVCINSPGGDVFAGAELYTALREHKDKGKVTVKVTGIAASAASVIAMAGDGVLMSPVAYMMIHDPWTSAVGNYREMEHQAQLLREIGEGLIAAYTAKTGKTRDEITALLAAETYMSAQRCVDEGFADGILYETPEPSAEGKRLDSSMMQASRHSPSAVLAMVKAHKSAHTAAVSAATSAGNGHVHSITAAHSHSLAACLPTHSHSLPSAAYTAPKVPQYSDFEAALRAKIAERAALIATLYPAT